MLNDIIKICINHKLENLVSSQILANEPLKEHTSFGIGGNASFYIFPNNNIDLKNILKQSDFIILRLKI